MRSLETAPGGGVATNGLSLAANYVVPNPIIAQSLGRLPANALPTAEARGHSGRNAMRSAATISIVPNPRATVVTLR